MTSTKICEIILGARRRFKKKQLHLCTL